MMKIKIQYLMILGLMLSISPNGWGQGVNLNLGLDGTSDFLTNNPAQPTAGIYAQPKQIPLGPPPAEATSKGFTYAQTGLSDGDMAAYESSPQINGIASASSSAPVATRSIAMTYSAAVQAPTPEENLADPTNKYFQHIIGMDNKKVGPYVQEDTVVDNNNSSATSASASASASAAPATQSAADTTQANTGNFTKDDVINACTNLAKNESEENAISNASPAMKKCVAVFGTDLMKDLNQVNTSTILTKIFQNETICNKSCKDYNEQKSTPKTFKDILSCAHNKISFVKGCISASYLIIKSGREWTENNMASHNVESKTTLQVGAQDGTQKNPQMALTTNQTIGCKSTGIETLDYEACQAFSDSSAIIDVAQQAIGTGQNLYFQNKALDYKVDVAKNQATDATASLKATKSSFEDQQTIYASKSALDATKTAYLLSKYNEMPDLNEIANRCSGISSSPKNLTVTEEDCRKVIDKNSGVDKGFKFLLNGDSKKLMSAKLVQAGISSLTNGALAEMAAQRAGQVDSAIASVNNFQASTTVADQVATSTFCTMNPTDAKCIGTLGPQNFATIGDNVVNFGPGGTGTVYGPNGTTTATNGSTNTSTGTSATPKSTGLVGSAITATGGDSGFVPAAAATVTKANAPAGGGGGGSAGSGGGGGGGIGGGAAGGGTPGSSGAINSKALTYSGGNGSLSMMGGFGINKAKVAAKDNTNPFNGMFDKGKAGADKVVNFRGPASAVGNKGDNLFDMISKRYNNVSSDKRLMEYEEVTK